MTDPFAKTLVIRDDEYEPGQLYPTRINDAGETEPPQAPQDTAVPMDYPADDDASWLT